jgi:biopolymer transport protein ExbB
LFSAGYSLNYCPDFRVHYTFDYNALVRGNKTTIAKLNKFGFDLHALFVTSSRSSNTETDAANGSSNGAKLVAVKGA